MALASGAAMDRGQGRVTAAKGVFSALRFAAHKLGLELRWSDAQRFPKSPISLFNGSKKINDNYH